MLCYEDFAANNPYYFIERENWYFHPSLNKTMKVEKYQLKSESNLTTFEFISEGPKGIIRKKIQFQWTSTPNLYNLAFGDTNPETGEIDDLVVSNNADSEKVLATVVSAVYAFFDKHPGAYVYATGSSDARNRLYRIALLSFTSK